MSERPWLIIPIETKARELDAKTYLACAAAEAGFRVMLGEQNALLRRLAQIPRGFYLDKSVQRLKIAPFEQLNKLGFRILASCEEGLVYLNRDAYLRERVAPEAFAQTEAFFAWGKAQSADLHHVIPDAEKRIFPTGNPRFDMLRPELREFYRPAADQLRDRFGEFMLINTNFGRYNHYFGRDSVLELLRQRGVIVTPADEVFFQNWVQSVREVFLSFEDMLPRLARAFPDRRIILRPHPSENHDSWRQLAADIPNVQVIHEGSVVPWLMAAQLMIHNGCTTGVEAALLDRPVLSYCKVRLETSEAFLPDRLSVNVTSFEELVASVQTTLDGGYRAPLAVDPTVRADAARHIASLDGPAATDQMVSTISMLAKRPGKSGGAIMARIAYQAEQAARFVARTTLAPWRQASGYSKQKFPGLHQGELENILERMRAITGRFGKIDLSTLSNNIFLVQKNAR